MNIVCIQFVLYTSTREISDRSNETLKWNIPRAKNKTCGDTASLVAAAILWNSLSNYIPNSQSIDTFKSISEALAFAFVGVLS